MKSNSLKLNIAFFAIALLVLSGLSVSSTQAGPSMQETMAATMADDGSAFPPCPQGKLSMMGTMEAAGTPAMMPTTEMMGTMEPSMSPTMSADFAQKQGCVFYAVLSGGPAEIPGPGDEDGFGQVTVKISRPASGPGEVCYEMQVNMITLPAAASHIHKGGADVAGPVVVGFDKVPDANGYATSCVSVEDRQLLLMIVTDPTNYYVNVHTSDFRGGAVRGQLLPDLGPVTP